MLAFIEFIFALIFGCIITGFICYRVGHSRGYEDCQDFDVKHHNAPVLPPLPYGMRKL